MRWLIAIAVLLATRDARAQAENYEPLRFDSGLTGSYVSASGRGGFGAMGEIKFLVHDNVSVGARFEGELMFGGRIGDEETQLDVAGAVSALAKGEYYVGDGPVRPFASFGIGVYDIASQSVAAGDGTAGVSQVGGRYFGIAPQIGFDLGRVRLAATYNLILGADVEVRQMVGTVEETKTFSQSYYSFELAIRFGGSRKRTPPPPPPTWTPSPVLTAPPPPPPYPVP